jgi:hypothetical protein
MLTQITDSMILDTKGIRSAHLEPVICSGPISQKLFVVTYQDGAIHRSLQADPQAAMKALAKALGCQRIQQPQEYTICFVFKLSKDS